MIPISDDHSYSLSPLSPRSYPRSECKDGRECGDGVGLGKGVGVEAMVVARVASRPAARGYSCVESIYVYEKEK